jgi:hypothetical protein
VDKKGEEGFLKKGREKEENGKLVKYMQNG